MEERNYIKELLNQNKLKEMIEDFYKHFPGFLNSFFNDYERTIKNNNSLSLWMTNNRLEHYNEYYITQYDCKPSNSHMSAHLDEKVRQWYFRFMNKTFDTFKEDYTNHILKKVNEDLGI